LSPGCGSTAVADARMHFAQAPARAAGAVVLAMFVLPAKSMATLRLSVRTASRRAHPAHAAMSEHCCPQASPYRGSMSRRSCQEEIGSDARVLESMPRCCLLCTAYPPLFPLLALRSALPCRAMAPLKDGTQHATAACRFPLPQCSLRGAECVTFVRSCVAKVPRTCAPRNARESQQMNGAKARSVPLCLCR